MKVGHLVAEISADKQTNRQTNKPRSEIIYVDGTQFDSVVITPLNNLLWCFIVDLLSYLESDLMLN